MLCSTTYVAQIISSNKPLIIMISIMTIDNSRIPDTFFCIIPITQCLGTMWFKLGRWTKTTSNDKVEVVAQIRPQTITSDIDNGSDVAPQYFYA